VETGEGIYAYLGWILGGVALAFVAVIVGMLFMDRRAARRQQVRRRGRTVDRDGAAARRDAPGREEGDDDGDVAAGEGARE